MISLFVPTTLISDRTYWHASVHVHVCVCVCVYYIMCVSVYKAVSCERRDGACKGNLNNLINV